MQSMSMNWTTAGAVPMTQMKMMSFRDALTTSLGPMAGVSKIGEHPLKWGCVSNKKSKTISPF